MGRSAHLLLVGGGGVSCYHEDLELSDRSQE